MLRFIPSFGEKVAVCRVCDGPLSPAAPLCRCVLQLLCASVSPRGKFLGGDGTVVGKPKDQ